MLSSERCRFISLKYPDQVLELEKKKKQAVAELHSRLSLGASLTKPGGEPAERLSAAMGGGSSERLANPPLVYLSALMAAALEDLPANASVIQQANYAFLRGKYSDAIKLYNKVLEVNPRDTSSLLNRAAASLQLELYKHVLRDTDAALAVEPLSLRAHQLKGRALAALNRREEAQQVWRAGLRILQGDAEQLLVLRNLLYGSSAGPAISSTVEPTVTPTTSLAVPATPITTVPASVPQGGSPGIF